MHKDPLTLIKKEKKDPPSSFFRRPGRINTSLRLAGGQWRPARLPRRLALQAWCKQRSAPPTAATARRLRSTCAAAPSGCAWAAPGLLAHWHTEVTENIISKSLGPPTVPSQTEVFKVATSERQTDSLTACTVQHLKLSGLQTIDNGYERTFSVNRNPSPRLLKYRRT